MHLLNYLTTRIMAASVLAAPSPDNAGLEIRQSNAFNFPGVCPFKLPYDCIANKQTLCINSGVQYCKEDTATKCSELCKAQAQRECGMVGCCQYKEANQCVGNRRSVCMASRLAVCQEPSNGGPPFSCDKWCKSQAEHECRTWGC
ncbi:hypothetical protein HYQ46_012538 [Verticillium longisporum]|nr:hypothetical protein HYQ46_012538 [Verticillium longisporum]